MPCNHVGTIQTLSEEDMKACLLAVALTALTATSATSVAADASQYPTKPVTVVVPYVAGGAADITARVVSQKLSDALGKTFVVENKPGANGQIGTDQVAKAKPDGYTLLMDASGPLVVNPVLYKQVPYDPVKDLAPITQLTSYQYVLVVPVASPIKSLDELVESARRAPGKLTYGSAGIGSGGHLAGELLALQAKAGMTHVPYKGNAQALADLLGGQLSFGFDTVVTAVPHIRGGKLRPFAVTGDARASALPDVPTMKELGFKDFKVTQFQGLLAPAGTDPAILERIRTATVTALKDPDVIRRLADEGGNDIVGGTRAEFAKLMRDELAQYRTLVRDAGIKAE
jgi:tripartite-type tricarboxylate transporter receptor subunit TctC